MDLEEVDADSDSRRHGRKGHKHRRRLRSDGSGESTSYVFTSELSSSDSDANDTDAHGHHGRNTHGLIRRPGQALLHDPTPVALVFSLGRKNWIDRVSWVRVHDFGEHLPASPLEQWAEKRARLISLAPQRVLGHPLVRGYRATKGIVQSRPWLFGNSFLSLVKQDTLPIKVNQFRVHFPSGFEETLKAYINYDRKCETEITDCITFYSFITSSLLLCFFLL